MTTPYIQHLIKTYPAEIFSIAADKYKKACPGKYDLQHLAIETGKQPLNPKSVVVIFTRRGWRGAVSLNPLEIEQFINTHPLIEEPQPMTDQPTIKKQYRVFILNDGKTELTVTDSLDSLMRFLDPRQGSGSEYKQHLTGRFVFGHPDRSEKSIYHTTRNDGSISNKYMIVVEDFYSPIQQEEISSIKKEPQPMTDQPTPTETDAVTELRLMVFEKLQADKAAAQLLEEVQAVEASDPALKAAILEAEKLEKELAQKRADIKARLASIREQNNVIYELHEAAQLRAERATYSLGATLNAALHNGKIDGAKPSALVIGEYQLNTQAAGYEVRDSVRFFELMQARNLSNHVTLKIQLGNKDAGVSRSDVNKILADMLNSDPDISAVVAEKPRIIKGISLVIPDTAE